MKGYVVCVYKSIGDDKALDAFQFSAKYEGILPALEPSHALGFIMDHAPNLDSKHIIVMNMCGRGDKDIFTVAEALNIKI